MQSWTTHLRVCNKTFLSIPPSPPSGTTGCNSDCLSVTREVKTSISTHIKWYKGPATHVTYCLLQRAHSFFSPHCCNNYKLLWPIKQAYNSCSDLSPLRLVGKKNEKLLRSLICPSSFLPLNNYSVNIWNQPHWWPVWWSIITTLTCTCADIIALLSPFPSFSSSQERPTYTEERRRLWYSRGQVELLVRWNRCDLHTGHSWQHSDPEEAISHLPPFNICPRAVASWPSPRCHVTWSPPWHVPFPVLAHHLLQFPF